MPVGPYKNMEACIKAIMKTKGFDKDRAGAYCAGIEYRATGEWPGAKKSAGSQAEVIAVQKEKFSNSRCMEKGCGEAPQYEVLWAEGMGRCWFCKKHFEEWVKESAKSCVEDGFPADCEINYVKKADGIVGQKWSDNKNPDIWDSEKKRLGIKKDAGEPNEEVTKSEDTERVAIYKTDHKKQLIFGTFLEPLKVDSQGDFEFAEEIQKAVHDYMINSRKVGVGHKGGAISAEPVQLYQAESDFWFDGTPHDEKHRVLKHSGVAVIKVYDKDVFARVEKGELNGFSIQGWGTRRKVRIKTNKALWTTAYINDLPDSSFAYIEPGKKVDGKTVPRSNRHLPYKDINGGIDAAHVRNALARLKQTNISAQARGRALSKLCGAAKKVGIKSELCD